MSRLYKPNTQEAYKISAGLLMLNLENGIVQAFCQQQGKNDEDTKEVKQAIKRLAKSLHERGRH